MTRSSVPVLTTPRRGRPVLRPAMALCLALSTIGVSAPKAFAQSQKTDEARSRFQRGVELFRDGDYRAALIEFKRAYELAPNYKVLYNLGQTSLELQDYASALKAFEQYLQAGGKDLQAKRKTEVEQEITKLRTRVAKVTIDVNVEGAEIAIDDIAVGKSPLTDTLIVSAGRRKISVSKAGLTSTTKMIDIAGGDNQRISLELVEPQTNVVTTTTTNPTTGNPETTTVVRPNVSPMVKTKNMTPVWIGLGVTGALAIGTGVFGALALGAKSGFDDRINTLGASSQSIDDARSRTRTFAVVADIFGASAIVAGGITLVLALTRPTIEKEQTARVETAPKIQVFVSPHSAGLVGSF